MNVRELIKELSKLNQDLPVYIYNHDTNETYHFDIEDDGFTVYLVIF